MKKDEGVCCINEQHEIVEYNGRNCYEIDSIYYDAETHLVAGTSVKHFPLLRMAKAIAVRAYEGKLRKTTGLPYDDHCTEIYRLCAHFKFSHGDDAMYAAAVLHDYLEDAVKRNQDQDATIEWMKSTLGYSVTTIVTELTNDVKNNEHQYPMKYHGDIKWVDKSEYINWKLTQMGSKALFIKLLDMLSNLGDAETLPNFVRRIREQITFINANRHTSFKNTMTMDHDLIMSAICRMLKDIYNE